MKKCSVVFALALGLRITHAGAQTDSTDAQDSQIEALRAQVQALTETVQALQQDVKSQKARWEGFHAPATEAIGGMKDIQAMDGGGGFDQLRQDVEELKTAQRQKRSGLFNPDISAAVDFITSYSKAANNWNFTLRDVELVVQSNIDQYARAYIVANASTELMPTEKTDIFGDTSLGIEEAAIVTTSLPYGLVVKGGEFFADFTRMAKVHPHDRPFVDGPQSVDEIIGGESKARGFEIDWLPPVSHYFRLTGGLVDNIGAEEPVTSSLALLDGDTASAFTEKVNRPFESLMAYGRAATLVEIGDGAVLHLGADYAQSGQTYKRQIASTDLKLEWQPDPASYDLFEFGGEALWTRQTGQFSDEAYFGGNRSASAEAAGGYAYAQYRFGKQWEPGFRVDYIDPQSFEQLDLNGNGKPDAVQEFRDPTWTYSGYLTFWASEFNRLRLQVSYVSSGQDIVDGRGRDDVQVFFQWTAILGAHKHEFQP